MKRNSILIFAVFLGILLVFNTSRRIMSLNTTSQKVEESDARLEQLRKENEALKQELEYKKSQEYKEEEIRNKLGLAKEGETVVVVPGSEQGNEKLETGNNEDRGEELANWQKWWELFFGSQSRE